MREIKFRAWDKEFKNITKDIWLNKDYLAIGFNGELYSLDDKSIDDENGSWTVAIKERFIIMHYTGLKDKNGKEIYEGDILKRFSSTYEEVWDECVFEGYHAAMGWTLKDQYDCSFIQKESGEYKIIGNIYENKV